MPDVFALSAACVSVLAAMASRRGEAQVWKCLGVVVMRVDGRAMVWLGLGFDERVEARMREESKIICA